MNSDDIVRCVSGDPLLMESFGGVISSDELISRAFPPFPRRPLFYVVNNRPSTSEGEHWVLFYLTPSEQRVGEFFDSLGNAPEFYTSQFSRYLTLSCSSYLYSSRVVQPPKSDTCGDFCVYYAARRLRGESMLEIVNGFRRDNLWYNHFKVRQFTQELRFN